FLLSLIQAKMIAEINSPDLRIIAQFFRAALTEYFPTFQDVCAIGDAESFPDVMIGNQHANSQIREVPDDPLKFLDGYRVNARERLVEENERRLQRERAGDFQPAALPARECVGFAGAHGFHPQLTDQLLQALA